MYIPQIGARKYMKQTLTNIKGEIDNNTIIVGDFHTPLTSVERSSTHPIGKTVLKWHNRPVRPNWYW